jgi:hypothetical protein
VEHIWKYIKKGFKYKLAYEKALEEMSHPQLNFTKNDKPV